MLWFKILSKTGRACHGGKYQYDLPKGKKPGAWTDRIDAPRMCDVGYHVTSAYNVEDWDGLSSRKRLFVAQVRGIVGDGISEDKIVCSQIRLVREIRISPKTRRRARQALAKALRLATKRWDFDKYYGSAVRERRWMGLVCAYIERKMGWRKD